jgi:hypothetical protein
MRTSQGFNREQVEARILVCRKEVDRREKELQSIVGLRSTYKEGESLFEDCNYQITRLQREMNSLRNIMLRLEQEYPASRSATASNDHDYSSISNLSSTQDIHKSASLEESCSEEPYSDTDEFSSDEDKCDSIRVNQASAPQPAQQTNSLVVNKICQGHCTVKFPFTPSPEQLATNQNLLEVTQGEQYYVTSVTDAWSCLQSTDGQRCGYVPTNYLEIAYYASNM